MSLFLLVLALAGCDPRRSDLAPSTAAASSGKPVAETSAAAVVPLPTSAILTSDPVAGTLDEVKTLTYESRSNLSGITDKMDGQINALMAQWVAIGRQIPKESDEQYRNMRKILTEKLNALTFATPETWSGAKDEAAVALQNVRGALHAMDTSAK